ncbi:hypothetical protein K491DRAFT_715249 [Lophiostoma macrostomum CBS 122681]|uniref:F-box domain-containing protein n=1 Tax=Lophiostoma macrostomum CBS 122681 TaxID=1314788 RepID=A0A6A6T9K8_9PLEO|nr:hypothetical protein K491DRAFT_715249 [Lophiostoma macrostomum CBS 122681]
MLLLDLAPEIFELIVRTFVEQATLPDIFHARGVCRTFARYIDHELLEELPIAQFVEKSNSGQEEWGWAPFNFFRERIHIFLAKRVRYPGVDGNTPNLVGFLIKIVETLLLEAPSSSCIDDLREQYVHDIVRAVVAMRGNTVHRLLIPHIPSDYESRTLEKYITQQDPDVADMIAAAAAVGNINAVEKRIRFCSKTLSNKLLFVHPIGAALVTGQLKVFKFLSEKIRKDGVGVTTSPWIVVTSCEAS